MHVTVYTLPLLSMTDFDLDLDFDIETDPQAHLDISFSLETQSSDFEKPLSQVSDTNSLPWQDCVTLDDDMNDVDMLEETQGFTWNDSLFEDELDQKESRNAPACPLWEESDIKHNGYEHIDKETRNDSGEESDTEEEALVQK